MNVVSFTRLDLVALELPPNDPSLFVNGVNLPQMQSALGGRTAPSGAGGMLPPERIPKLPVPEGDVPRAFVLSSAAPPDRQKDYCNDGGTITATPPFSVREQELKKGVADIVGEADMKVLEQENFFQPGQYPDEGK